jgi:hypothetical protein
MGAGVLLVITSVAGVLGVFRGTAGSPGPSQVAVGSPAGGSAAPSPSATAAPAIATPTPTVAASSSPDRLAAVNALYARLIPAVRGPDVETLFSLLHPATIARYGEAGCRAYFANLRDPTFNVVVRSVAPPAPWNWERDDRSTLIADAWAIQADLTSGGTTAVMEIHVAPIAGELRWFTDCGTAV